jgi:hypothetical protein
VEPLPDDGPETRRTSAQLLCDIVSPNWLEAGQMDALDDLAALVRAMLADGAPVAGGWAPDR